MLRLPGFLLAAPTLLILGSDSGRVCAESVSFRNDVMAVLSRAGCNSGPCHGNLNGKGGLKLSLRGQDPDFDLAVLTRDTLARRIDRQRPETSLLLTKPTSSLPHEGGQRFQRESPEYATLLRWIRAGASGDTASTPRVTSLEATPRQQILFQPADRVQLRVTAAFSDGSTRDVTRLAVLEPSNLIAKITPGGEVIAQNLGETSILVRYLDQRSVVQLAFRPARPDFTWSEVPESNFIDHHVFGRLRQLRIQPSELCSDEVFVRRVYLDTLGILPGPQETRLFLGSTEPDKRARLIDGLLQRPEFADFWALKWSDLLRNEEKVLDRHGVRVFHAWLRRAIVDGKPLNELARELVAGQGSTYLNPPANYYRALRDTYTRAEATAQVFLGIRLQCAKCHNHPFDRWTQTDYHSLAAFFNRIDYRIVENNRKDRLDKHEFAGEQIVYQARSGELIHPVTGEALAPHFLGADTPPLKPSEDRLRVLADWIARPDNPFFARAQVNRVWFHLMGRGIVDPNDDFRESNPPVNGDLLEALTRDFVEHRFDLRHLVRTILLSRTYQLSAVPNDGNRDDDSNFSHALVRPLQAEQLYDAITGVVGVSPTFEGFPAGTRAGQLPAVPLGRRGRLVGEGPRFLAVFGKPARLLNCECERSEDTTLAQAFQLITGPTLNGLLSEPDNRLGKLLAAGRPMPEVIDELYLAALCRRPHTEERRRAVELVERARDRRAALEDVLWGLVNAKEFLLRR
jgi:hypothetical protein